MMRILGKNTCVQMTDKDTHIKTHMEDKIKTTNDEGPFFIADLGDIVKKFHLWRRCFPKIEPFYAVKCNDLQPVLQLMADLGMSFDCASQMEIEKVLRLGVHPSKIIYANSCKQTSFIQFALNNGVNLMTFDNEEELLKIKKVFPEAELLLRIRPPSKYKVKLYLGKKFGCHPKEERRLLEIAKKLKLNVIGVSFHVGSGCTETKLFDLAIQQARGTFQTAMEVGFSLTLLDIGGGIPGNAMPDYEFENMATVINQSINKNFSDMNVRLIAEPGQFFVTSAFTLAANVIAKRIEEFNDDDDEEEEDVDDKGDHNKNNDNQDKENCNTEHISSEKKEEIDNFIQVRQYYINEGVYGSLSDVRIFPGCFVPLHFKNDSEPLYKSIVWGPTCDSYDMVIEDFHLPDLKVGEWIYFKDMGAYTLPMSSGFNSMEPPKMFYICNKISWEKIYGANVEDEGDPSNMYRKG